MGDNTASSHFTEFLVNTLIPDLKESEDYELAKLFERAVRSISKTKSDRSKRLLNELDQVEKCYREIGRENTARDLRTCYELIYWNRG